MHIGERIRQVMKEKRISVVSVAREISCERTNIYNIFARKDINTSLLQKFCVILNHDFFKELSKEMKESLGKK
jgi:hypothetical protein